MQSRYLSEVDNLAAGYKISDSVSFSWECLPSPLRNHLKLTNYHSADHRIHFISYGNIKGSNTIELLDSSLETDRPMSHTFTVTLKAHPHLELSLLWWSVTAVSAIQVLSVGSMTFMKEWIKHWVPPFPSKSISTSRTITFLCMIFSWQFITRSGNWTQPICPIAFATQADQWILHSSHRNSVYTSLIITSLSIKSTILAS